MLLCWFCLVGLFDFFYKWLRVVSAVTIFRSEKWSLYICFTCSSWCLCAIFCYFNFCFVNSFWNIKTTLLCQKTQKLIVIFWIPLWTRVYFFLIQNAFTFFFSAESKDDITIRYFTWTHWICVISLGFLLLQIPSTGSFTTSRSERQHSINLPFNCFFWLPQKILSSNFDSATDFSYMYLIWVSTDSLNI